MYSEIIEDLDKRIQQEISDIFLTKPEEPGYTQATDRLDKLIRARLELEKFDAERQLNAAKALNEDASAKKENRDKMIKNILTGAGIVLPLIVSWIWMGRGLRFEETGAYTSKTRQWLGGYTKTPK